MRKTIRIMMWFLRKLYQCDKKRFGSMAALIVIRAIKTLLSVITIKVALDCVDLSFFFVFGNLCCNRACGIKFTCFN